MPPPVTRTAGVQDEQNNSNNDEREPGAHGAIKELIETEYIHEEFEVKSFYLARAAGHARFEGNAGHNDSTIKGAESFCLSGDLNPGGRCTGLAMRICRR